MANQTEKQQSISLAVSGSGGSGAMTAGNLLLDAASKGGWYGLMTRTAGPQIRGGEAAALLRFSNRPLAAVDDHCDVLFAMDWLNIDRFSAEIPLGPKSLVIGDSAAADPPPAIVDSGAEIVTLPIADLLAPVEGGRPNMFALGVLAAVTGLPNDALSQVIDRAIGKKGDKALQASHAATDAGRDAAASLANRFTIDTTEDPAGRWNISGNEATGFGAVKGGVRFVAAYPITPATEVLEWMAPALAKVGGTLVQAEDELSSINMIIGASYGGAPSLTATSGPGLALMTESIGLATASETPIVVVDVMRGGPSTGIPTKSEQSDLNIALYGLHGDAPHVVVAPQSIGDCVFTAQWAVHLAESLQVPVILLSDQFLGQSRAIIDRPADIAFLARRDLAESIGDQRYDRYTVTKSGVSPMALPGTAGGQYTADGLTHSVRGTPSTKAEDHQVQLDKRARKIDGFDYGDHWAEISGDGELAIITWGSVTGAVQEALERARESNIGARLIAPRLLAPTQPEKFTEALSGVNRALVVEQTHSAQFYRYLRAHYDLPADTELFHRPGPLPIRPSEILDYLSKGG